MANQQHLEILKQGVGVWNKWRQEHRDIQPDLSRANLSRANLREVDLSFATLRDAILKEASLRGANLRGANLSEVDLWKANLWKATLSNACLIKANLRKADLREADLREAILWGADLRGATLLKATLRGASLSGATLRDAILRKANLSGAKLSGVDLSGIDLSGTNLSRVDLGGKDLTGVTLRKANLSGANLSGVDLSGKDLSEVDFSGAILVRAILVNSNLEHANLTGCSIFGISVWNVQLRNTTQSNLIITDKGEPTITVDNLDVAQFIYLLLNNENIRRVIDTITYKVVLILGRFTPERKAVLDALRDELRTHGYLPILFDFDKPASRDITETVSTLAHLARFVIADITDAKSIPQELMIIVPNLPSVPVQPLILESQHEYGMFEHFKRFPWVLPVYRYTDEVSLFQSLQAKVIAPAEQKVQELAKEATANGGSGYQQSNENTGW